MKKIFLLTSLMIFLSITAFAQFGTYQEKTIQRAAPEKKRVLLCGHSEAPIRVAGYMNYPPLGWKETHTMEGQGGMLERDKIVATYYGIGAVLFDKFAKENHKVQQHSWK